MFRTSDLARVAVSEFRRGLEGLTAEEAATRLPKADGTTMNAIAWSVQHIAQHWSNARWAATGAPGSVPPAPSDGTPPSWQDALAYLDSATSDLSWIEETSDEQFAAIPSFSQRESTGTFLGRAIFHTWFHTGEINAVRQMLGHPEIMFVGAAGGELAWVPSRGVER